MSKLDFVWLKEYHCLLYYRGRLLVGTAFAFMTHMIVTYSQNNKAFNHVIAASSSSWLQEHVADMSERYVISVLVAHLNCTVMHYIIVKYLILLSRIMI